MLIKRPVSDPGLLRDTRNRATGIAVLANDFCRSIEKRFSDFDSFLTAALQGRLAELPPATRPGCCFGL